MRASCRSIAAVAWSALACTIPTTTGDAGQTDAGSQTVGDQCGAIALAFCQRAQACNAAGPLSDCLANEVPTCCIMSTCAATSRSSRAAVDACTSAIAVEDCYAVQVGGPAALVACQGIPQKP